MLFLSWSTVVSLRLCCPRRWQDRAGFLQISRGDENLQRVSKTNWKEWCQSKTSQLQYVTQSTEKLEKIIWQENEEII